MKPYAPQRTRASYTCRCCWSKVDEKILARRMRRRVDRQKLRQEIARGAGED